MRRLTLKSATAPLTPAEVALGQRWVIRCSVISMLYWAGINDRVISLFVLRLDPAITDATLAFFFAIGPMSAILTAAVSPIVEWRGKKRMIVPFYVAASLLIFCLALLPGMARLWGPVTALVAAATILATHAVLRSIGQAGWFPIIDDNVPAESRGRFFGRLRTSWQLMLVFCSWAVGAFLGHAPTLGHFQVVFVIATLASVVMAIAVMAIPEAPVAARPSSSSFWRMLGVPFRDRPYLWFIIFCVLYNLALAMPGPSAVRCLKSTLHAGDNMVVWLDTVASIGAAIALPLWGRFVDRFGGRPLFALLLPPLAVINLIWLAASPTLAHWPWLVGTYSLLNGMFLFGIGVGITDMMLSGARDGHRSAYINIAFVANTVAAGVAPFLGALIARHLQAFNGHWGPLTLDGNRWVFLLRALLMIAPLLVVRRLSREHGGHVGESLQQLSAELTTRLPLLRRR